MPASERTVAAHARLERAQDSLQDALAEVDAADLALLTKAVEASNPIAIDAYARDDDAPEPVAQAMSELKNACSELTRAIATDEWTRNHDPRPDHHQHG
jgi:hypothetical protein